VQNPVLDITKLVLQDDMSDNASGADNQQERLSIDTMERILRDYTPNSSSGT